jgi:hypothetical protein
MTDIEIKKSELSDKMKRIKADMSVLDKRIIE